MIPRGLREAAARVAWLTRGYPWLIPMLVALGLASFLFEALAIYLLVPIVDLLTGAGQAAGRGGPVPQMIRDWPLGALLAAMVGLMLAKGGIRLASGVAVSAASGRIGHALRRRCFSRIVEADQAFQARQAPGDLLNLLSVETWQLSAGLQSVAALIVHGCAIAIFVGLMLVLSVPLTLMVLAGVGAILLIVRLATARAHRAGRAAVRANRRLAGRIEQGLDGLDTIRLFGREGDELRRFSTVSDRARRAFLRMEVLSALPPPLMDVLFAVLLAGLIFYMQSGSVSVLIAFLALLQRLLPHVAAMASARVALSGLRGAQEAVAGLLDQRASAPMISGSAPVPPMSDGLVLERVTLTYPDGARPVLDRVTMTIPAGKTTALIGRSGAGKSSVVRLICRTIDPVAGRVAVDGTDLRDIDLAAWRARCAVVPQDPFLFDASLFDNIAYGRPGATAAQVEAAACAAQAHDFIAALPGGYRTRMGDRGGRFSGGQRQRIALARALLREADLLILDEATSALDRLSERLVQDALDQARGRQTVVVVAHQMASIERADHVVVLDAGRVVEAGPPEALRQGNGEFARLFGLARRSA